MISNEYGTLERGRMRSISARAWPDSLYTGSTTVTSSSAVFSEASCPVLIAVMVEAGAG